MNIHRWNFDADDESLMVCRGHHDKNAPCENHMVRLNPHEALKIINELRAMCIKYETLFRQAGEISTREMNEESHNG